MMTLSFRGSARKGLRLGACGLVESVAEALPGGLPGHTESGGDSRPRDRLGGRPLAGGGHFVPVGHVVDVGVQPKTANRSHLTSGRLDRMGAE